ncbi:hypothetical protein NL676_035888 [Syzygium grande]|nr:hypothetical protein NL676_035888 [Syzygium grande]
MDGLGDSPPLWPPPPPAPAALRRGRRPPPSTLLSPPVLIVLFPVLVLALLFFVIPSLVSFSSHVLRPVAVRRSWDSLNVLLVLFAILCGIFARGVDDEEPAAAAAAEEVEKGAARVASDDKAHETTVRRWFEPGEDKVFGYSEPAMRSPGSGVGRLRRSSSSYPDLKQDSPWETGDDRFRFFDDFEVSSKYSSSSTQFDRVAPLRRWRSAIDEDDVKVIPVDTFVLRTPPSPASPPPPPAAKSPAPPPTPPPPPPPPVRRTYEGVAPRSTGVGQAMKLNLLKSEGHRQRRRLRLRLRLPRGHRLRRRRSTDDLPFRRSNATTTATSAASSSGVRLPQPVPKEQQKQENPLGTRAPAAPAATGASAEESPAAAPKPPLPAKPVVHQPGSGALSPPITMPPPPPARVPEFRFAAGGDFVGLRSARSSPCSSPELPELEDAEVPSSPGSAAAAEADGRDRSDGVVRGAPGGTGMFCPSPDVNVKADTFIARFKDGWRLEKMNSIREKQSVGGSAPPPPTSNAHCK